MKLGFKILATYYDWNLETTYKVSPVIFNFKKVSCHPLYKKEKKNQASTIWVFFFKT